MEQKEKQQDENEYNAFILRQQVQKLIDENTEHKQQIVELNEKIRQYDESNAENSKVCTRIMAKAESDNVAFRAQIQQLLDEKYERERKACSKEKAMQKSLNDILEVLRKKGAKVKTPSYDLSSSSDLEYISFVGSSSSSSSEERDQTKNLFAEMLYSLQVVISRIEEGHDKLHSKVVSLEQQLTESEVTCKTAQSKNQILRGEKDFLLKKQRELERRICYLEGEKESMQVECLDLKNKKRIFIRSAKVGSWLSPSKIFLTKKA